MILYYLYLVCLLLSALMSFIYRKDLQSRQLFIFIPFLIYTFVQEFALFIYLHNWTNTSTGIVYNFYIPARVIVLSGFFYFIPFNAPLRKLILWMVIIYLAITIVTFCFIQPVAIYNSYLSLAAGMIITCCAIFFLFNYFTLDNRTLEKHWRPVIWITIGIVTFFPVVNISFSFYKQLLAYRADILGIKLYKVIPQIMSIFMYSCFTYAFYLCKKKN